MCIRAGSVCARPRRRGGRGGSFLLSLTHVHSRFHTLTRLCAYLHSPFALYPTNSLHTALEKIADAEAVADVTAARLLRRDVSAAVNTALVKKVPIPLPCPFPHSPTHPSFGPPPSSRPPPPLPPFPLSASIHSPFHLSYAIYSQVYLFLSLSASLPVPPSAAAADVTAAHLLRRDVSAAVNTEKVRMPPPPSLLDP